MLDLSVDRLHPRLRRGQDGTHPAGCDGDPVSVRAANRRFMLRFPGGQPTIVVRLLDEVCP